MRILTPAVLLLITSCADGASGGDETCSAEVASGAYSSCGLPDAPCTCELEISSCTSDATYRIACEESGDGLLDCDCYLDDVKQDSFELDAVCELDPPRADDWVASMNTGCGWDITMHEEG